MPSTPSRSEIETALSGRSKRSKAKQKKAARKDLDLEIPPRRQQVIGGDLSGVTSRPKQGFLSRYSDLGLPYWIGIGMVVLIVVAFFWPQPGDSTREVTEAQAKKQSELVSSIEPISTSEDEVDAEVKVFTRDSDLERAETFRAQEQNDSQIRALLQAAEAHIAKGEYTKPANNNAVAKYRTALAIDPNNRNAKQGLENISDRFLASGIKALERDKESVALNALDRLAAIDESSEQYQEFSATLQNWQQTQKINDLISKADEAYEENNLILPASANALLFYRQALDIDSDSEAALNGIQKIADTFVERANKAVLDGKYQAAAAHLATVSVIDPEHPSIALIEAMMTRAEPLANRAEQSSNEATERASQSADSNATDTTAAAPDTPTTTSNSDTPSATTGARDESSDARNEEPVVANTTRPSSERTPARQASEQADFDRQYLKQGLEAYYKGEYETAAALLQPLADKGIARAQFRLAYMHYLGRGFKRNTTEADRMIRAALPAIRKFAEEGRAWAQSDLGSLYEDGLVLPRNFTEAVYWYRSAAEQGYPGAQTNLGIMYARGRGVASSRRTAIEWFQRAAQQGDSVAKRNLEALGIN